MGRLPSQVRPNPPHRGPQAELRHPVPTLQDVPPCFVTAFVAAGSGVDNPGRDLRRFRHRTARHQPKMLNKPHVTSVSARAAARLAVPVGALPACAIRPGGQHPQQVVGPGAGAEKQQEPHTQAAAPPPCQDFSVIAAREGHEGDRGRLFLTSVDLMDATLRLPPATRRRGASRQARAGKVSDRLNATPRLGRIHQNGIAKV